VCSTRNNKRENIKVSLRIAASCISINVVLVMDISRTYDVRFPQGSTHLMCGASGSGKTYRIAEILRLKDEIFRNGTSIKNVVFYYDAWQPLYDKMKSEGVVTKWVNKMPTKSEYIEAVKYFKDKGGSIVIIDDFMQEVGQDMCDIVCVCSRHYNVSTFILFQNLFHADKSARTISRNVRFLHLHKCPRDNAQVRVLASQLCPGNFKWIVDAFTDATRYPYSCLLFDFSQDCPEELRYRSSYLPTEFPIRVWQEKK